MSEKDYERACPACQGRADEYLAQGRPECADEEIADCLVRTAIERIDLLAGSDKDDEGDESEPS